MLETFATASRTPGKASAQSGLAGTPKRLAGAAAAAPHRPGVVADGRLATAESLKVCALCMNPKLVALNASGVLPHRIR